MFRCDSRTMTGIVILCEDFRYSHISHGATGHNRAGRSRTLRTIPLSVGLFLHLLLSLPVVLCLFQHIDKPDCAYPFKGFTEASTYQNAHAGNCIRFSTSARFDSQNLTFLLRTCAKKGGTSNIRKEPTNLSEFPISSLALCLATGSIQYQFLLLF